MNKAIKGFGYKGIWKIVTYSFEIPNYQNYQPPKQLGPSAFNVVIPHYIPPPRIMVRLPGAPNMVNIPY